MVFARPPHFGNILDWHRDIAGMVEAEKSGAQFKWRCNGCAKGEVLDLAAYAARLGPRWSPQNDISVCPCGSPRTLLKKPGGGSPFTPCKDEDLFISREIGYGRDPEAWFEIDWIMPRAPKG